MNVVILKGRLGADPEIRTTPTGKKVARLRLAVDRRGKDAGVDWLNVIAWEKTADFAEQYFSKGRPILVSGRIQTRQYEKDGQKTTMTEVIADSLEFCDSKPQGQQAAPAAQTAPPPQQQAAPQASPPAAMPSAPILDDDIPF